MKNRDCSKEKVLDAYYNETKDEYILKHIESCAECGKFYDSLKSTGNKMELFNNVVPTVNPFTVKKIINTHLAEREKRRIMQESLGFFLGSSAFITIFYGTIIAYDFRYAAVFYLLIFSIMPFLLIPAVLKRKEMN